MLLHDRRHFRTGALVYALADGFDDEERRRALRHFGSGCRVCWGRLEELQDAPIRLDASRDFVARALGRALAARRGVYEVPVMMTAIHLYWMGRVALDPAVLPRLAIEEASLLEVEAPREGRRALADAVELLAVPRWRVRAYLKQRSQKQLRSYLREPTAAVIVTFYRAFYEIAREVGSITVNAHL